MDNILPSTFAEESFAKLNVECFDAYIEYRLKGVHSHIAFTRLFGADSDSNIKAEMMEHNPYFQREFSARLSALTTEKMWDEKRAVHAFMEMMKNPFFKDSTRLQALKELNVLMGITEVDDAGRTRKVPTMEDMYGEAEASTGKP